MQRNSIVLFTIILGLLIATEAFTIDSSLPAMPAIALGLGTDNAAVQISLSMFMLGMAVGQIVHGPLSDRFGRKPILLFAAGLYTVVTLGTVFVTDVETLTALRLVQGFAGAAGHILTRAIVRDRFDREAAARLLSYIMLMLALAPVVAPILGAHLTIWLGWRSVFVFLTIYGAVVVIANLIFLEETHTSPDRRALHPTRMASAFAEVMASRVFWGYLLCAASAFAGLFAFLAGSSAVMISYLGLGADTYGYVFAAVMVGHLGGLVWGGRVVGRYGIDRLLRIGVITGAVGGVMMGVLAWTGVTNVAAIAIPAFVFMTAFALIVPQAAVSAMSPFPHIAGAASSLMGFLQLSTGAATGAIVAHFNDGTQLSMTNAIFVAGLVGLIGYLLVVPKRKVAAV